MKEGEIQEGEDECGELKQTLGSYFGEVSLKREPKGEYSEFGIEDMEEGEIT